MHPFTFIHSNQTWFETYRSIGSTKYKIFKIGCYLKNINFDLDIINLIDQLTQVCSDLIFRLPAIGTAIAICLG